MMGLAALAPEQFDGLVLRQFAERALARSRFQGELTLDAVLEAVGKEPGPERVLDVLLRVGPYGDGCGREPGGPHARARAAERARPRPRSARADAAGPHRHREREASSSRPSAWSPTCRGSRPGSTSRQAPALQLINRRDLRSMNSWLHNLPALAKGRERCTLQIHPQDAAARGLADGAARAAAQPRRRDPRAGRGDATR